MISVGIDVLNNKNSVCISKFYDEFIKNTLRLIMTKANLQFFPKC